MYGAFIRRRKEDVESYSCRKLCNKGKRVETLKACLWLPFSK